MPFTIKSALVFGLSMASMTLASAIPEAAANEAQLRREVDALNSHLQSPAEFRRALSARSAQSCANVACTQGYNTCSRYGCSSCYQPFGFGTTGNCQ